MDKLLKIQDKEIEMKLIADKLIKEKNLDQAISIYEELVYKYINEKSYWNGLYEVEGTMCRAVVNPIYLVNLYFKSKMYDKCWKLLNLMIIKYPEQKEKIREYQSKISTIEERHKDALMFILMSLVNRYFNKSDLIDEVKIEKLLLPKIKKANLQNVKDEIIALIKNNINNNNYENTINEFMKQVVHTNK